MLKWMAAAAALALSVSTHVAAENVPLTNDKEKVSYAVGQNIGENVKNSIAQIKDEVEMKILIAGLIDAMTGAAPQLPQADQKKVIEAFQKGMQAKMEEKAKVAVEKNKGEGEKFLADNKTKPGVVTLPSGLQYQELKAGDGATPTATDTVTAHYTGTLLDGTVFDSSVQRGEPADFPVNGVIAGWTEALQKMKVGSKWKLFIPSNLAYGAHGAGGQIGPNATLVFEVELLGIKKK